MIFIVEPKNFLTVDNTFYTIEGISAKINNSKEITIGSNNPINFEITFWSKNENSIFYEKSKITGNFLKKYNVPNVGDFEIMSGLFSSDPQTIYNSVNFLCNYYGYVLKPMNEQNF